MNESRRLLPSLSSLTTLVAIARHGGFSRAAAEVALTQSAISRQMAALETQLGIALFERRGRRVKLTEAGRTYVEAVEPTLRALRRATATLVERRSERVVELAVLPSFGMRWLAPRLARLAALHPDLVVNLTTHADEFAFADERFDAAIHFGRPHWPGGSLDLLFEESTAPVAAPARLVELPIRTPHDLAGHPLLRQSARPDAWARWFEAQGEAVPGHATSGPLFSHFMMMAQAAAAGAGVALMPTFLVEDELRTGVLVDPLGLPGPSAGAYWLVTPEGRATTSGLRDLRAWMLAEARPPV